MIIVSWFGRSGPGEVGGEVGGGGGRARRENGQRTQRLSSRRW